MQNSKLPATIPGALTVDDLWSLKRVSGLSMSPDGRLVCASVSSYHMADNKSSSALWLFDCELSDSAKPKERILTTCGEKDSNPQFSPDGREIAFVAKRGDDQSPQIYLISLDGGEARRLTKLATGASDIRWVGNGDFIAFISWVVPGLKSDQEQAAHLKAQKEAVVQAKVIESDDYRYWDHWVDQQRQPHIHVVDVRTGVVNNLTAGTGYCLTTHDPSAAHYAFSQDAQQLAIVYKPVPLGRSDAALKLVRFDLQRIAKGRNAGLKVVGDPELLTTDDGYDYSNPLFSTDGTQLACIRSHFDADFMAPSRIAVIDLLDSKSPTLDWLPNWDREPQGALAWHPSGAALFFTAEDQGCLNLYMVRGADAEPTIVHQGGTVAEFAINSHRVVVAANSATFPTRLLARPFASLRAGSMLLGDAAEVTKRIDTLNDDLLCQRRIGEVKSYWVDVKTEPSSKKRVQVWVTFPVGFDPKRKYRLMHSIHGGPHTCMGDAWHYRWNTQVFAAHNFIVACVQYHGSTSYGQAFKSSITGNWGELEAHDIDAATQFLIRQGFVDPEKVVATGGSYGGYMVAMLNGRAHTVRAAQEAGKKLKLKPDLYKAYVCHAGCFDWVSMFAGDAYHWHWRELGASYFQDMDRQLRQSPHAYAQYMQTPTLVMHGELDYRVPYYQGTQYYNTLRFKGIDSRMVFFPDENHWILKPQNSKLWFTEFFNWLNRYV